MEKTSGLSFAVVIVSASLTACGGSDGDDGFGTTSTAFSAAPPIAITADNSDQVVAEAGAAFESSGVATALKPSSSQTRLPFDLPRLMSGMSPRYAARLASRQTGQEACTDSGSLSYDVADDYSTGTVTFSNCNEGGDVMNGSLTFTDNGNTLTASFSNFSMTSPLASFSANGSMTIATNEFGDRDEVQVTSSSNFIMSMTYNNRTVQIGNYSENSVYYYSGLDAMNMQFTFNSSSLGGSVTLQTTQTLMQNSYEEYPYEGQVVITGASSSKVRATSFGGTSTSNVLIQTDADGDGIYESNQTLTWQEVDESTLAP